MAIRSTVNYSGLDAKNMRVLKDIQKAESAVSVYYNSLGGETKRTSHWNIDENGNVSHYANVRREDQINKELRKESENNKKELIGKTREKVKDKYKYNTSLHTTIQSEGVSYEKTISDSISAGIEIIQGIEKKLRGTKFFIGNVSYGQTYGNLTDTNFVINPEFLSKLGNDETTRS